MRRKPKTAAQKVLAKSRWYKPPTLAKLAKGHKSTARRINYWQWEKMLVDPDYAAERGICFPYRQIKIRLEMPKLDIEESANAA